ncbi:MAG: MBL fold metallo-hydrolase, partial [Pseudomonadales bacterium]|nr:MBL fold metallo-hydrolase [Pseudomonadales bacterium]
IQVIDEAERKGGNILIPAFAVGRTQELLFQLGKLYHRGGLRNWVVCLDTPMGKAVTDTYSRFLADLDPQDTRYLKKEHAASLTEYLPNLVISESVDDSIAINRIKQGVIIIAGSGMCTGGRIRHHFKHRLWSADNHVVLVGYQAQGTLGRMLVDGIKSVKLFGQTIAVKAKIHTIGGFSAHAGLDELLVWSKAFACCPRFFLVHGEEKSLENLQHCLGKQLSIKATIPSLGDRYVF